MSWHWLSICYDIDWVMSSCYENDIDHSHGKYSIDFMAYIADPDEPMAQIIW